MDNQKRIDKLLASIENDEAVLITCDENIFYFSGFDGGDSSLILFKNKKYLFTDFRYTEQAEKQTKGFDIVECNGSNKYEKYMDVICGNGISNIGIEKDQLTVFEHEKIQKYFDGFSFIGRSENINQIRSIKSDKEIELIKHASKINDLVFVELIKQIKSGITEMDIYTELTYLLNKNGCTHSFTPIIASGENSALPHAPTTDRILKEKDFLTLDFGAKYKNYCSDFTRTIGIGGLDNLQEKVYNLVKRAHALACEAIQSKSAAFDIDMVARDYISENGFDGKFEHGLGHGVGLFIHEGITLSKRSEDILEENMVFSIEPGIYLKGQFGVRIEDIGTITKDGFESFNSSFKELIII